MCFHPHNLGFLLGAPKVHANGVYSLTQIFAIVCLEHLPYMSTPFPSPPLFGGLFNLMCNFD